MNKQDEEKAKEIANKYNQSKDNFGNNVYNVGYEACCLEMAAWKQEQIINWLEKNASHYVVCDEAEFSHFATKSMIEDLKKAILQ